MKCGDLVQFKHFKDSGENLKNIGVILEMQTDLIIPSRYGGALYEKVDLLHVRWLDQKSEDRVPYYKMAIDEKKWYLKKYFYLVF